jgi:hypothetical protein
MRKLALHKHYIYVCFIFSFYLLMTINLKLMAEIISLIHVAFQTKLKFESNSRFFFKCRVITILFSII